MIFQCGRSLERLHSGPRQRRETVAAIDFIRISQVRVTSIQRRHEVQLRIEQGDAQICKSGYREAGRYDARFDHFSASFASCRRLPRHPAGPGSAARPGRRHGWRNRGSGKPMPALGLIDGCKAPMTSLSAIRAGKPAHYPDQAVHCEFAARALGLGFADLDAGTGLLFEIRSADRRAAFGAGRGSFFPQNTATAATLANDKYFANVLMTQAGVPNLGGTYFFLHDRYRSHRAPGRERSDAESYFRALGTHAFIKPLNGSRGDFAQIVDSAEDLSAYLDHVQQYYDAVIMQPVFRGREYRIFMLDDEVVYSVAKETPTVTGDGRASLRDLIAGGSAQLDR